MTYPTNESKANLVDAFDHDYFSPNEDEHDLKKKSQKENKDPVQQILEKEEEF